MNCTQRYNSTGTLILQLEVNSKLIRQCNNWARTYVHTNTHTLHIQVKNNAAHPMGCQRNTKYYLEQFPTSGRHLAPAKLVNLEWLSECSCF